MSKVSLNPTGSSPAVPRRTGSPTAVSRGDSGEIRNPGRTQEAGKSSAVGDIDAVQLRLLDGIDFSTTLSEELAPEARQSAMEPITRQLGSLLTDANPVWRGDPVPGMRALQKKLIEHSLASSPESRGPCLKAISVVEGAVRLRLRLQQMRMDELGMNSGTEAGEE